MVSSNKRDRRKPDHYTDKAKKAGFAARSVFKLEEIDRRHRILSPGMAVLDLGCAPGSWTKYAARVVGKSGRVVGIDITAMTAPAPNATILTMSIFDAQGELARLAAAGFNVVLSDMAPATTGISDVDEARSLDLARAAMAAAAAHLRAGGDFLCKVFQGGDTKTWIDEIRRTFNSVDLVRPDAVRRDSREIYVLARGFRPTSGMPTT
ncbi:MAG: RlmE family RNA methyltransferase [Deltaproteobacteria bacterium]|nr:RlmE family RNA methyltransferase [Deltaproteobacteria bacterium]